MKTYSAKAQDVNQSWYLIDATGKTLGRLSTEIAKRLSGKHKPIYTKHIDTGDYIVVINAKNIKVTGDKLNQKKYYRVSGYMGGIKDTVLKDVLSGKYPERALMSAVKGMLPRNILGREMLKKLKVYAGEEHPHAAQQPQVLELVENRKEG